MRRRAQTGAAGSQQDACECVSSTCGARCSLSAFSAGLQHTVSASSMTAQLLVNASRSKVGMHTQHTTHNTQWNRSQARARMAACAGAQRMIVARTDSFELVARRRRRLGAAQEPLLGVDLCGAGALAGRHDQHGGDEFDGLLDGCQLQLCQILHIAQLLMHNSLQQALQCSARSSSDLLLAEMSRCVSSASAS